MYIVKIRNGDTETPIHNQFEKLNSGSISKGINTIDSFTFSMLPDNAGFDRINEFSTLVTAYNTNKSRYDFIGRVLYAETTMDENGLIEKTVTCENINGYLCDSVQLYVDAQNWTVTGLLQHLLDCHNSQVEEYKRIQIGVVTVEDPNDNLYQGIQRESTWDAIKTKLLDKIGGEIQLRVEDGTIYLDYLPHIGDEKETEIALSVNMKSITREQDPTKYVTRLIPLGCKLTVDGEETEQRLDIASVNNGRIYIDDEEAIAVYGIHVGVVEWDNVTVAENLIDKGRAWFAENNKVQVKYSISALDLSLIGLAFDDFDVGNTHPVKNALLRIDDKARIIKKTINICEEIESTIEVGDNFKTLSDIQREQYAQLANVSQSMQGIKTQTDSALVQVKNLDEKYSSEIQQLEENIKLEIVGDLGSVANITLSVGANKYSNELDLSQIRQAFANDNTAVSITGGLLTFNAGTLVINSTYFSVTSEGVISATSGTIGAITLCERGIYSNNEQYASSFAGWYRPETISTDTECFFAGAFDQYGTNAKYIVTYGGKLKATDAIISGEIITESGKYKTELNSGHLELYFDSALCGTINTKYWSGASGEGISLRIEEGGKYIMFSHPSTAATGYDVDYYLNYGWSSNYDEKHIFQTSARFLDKTYFQSAYFSAAYLNNGAVLKAYDSAGDTYELIKYSSDRVTVGNNSYITMICGKTVYLKNTSSTVTSDRRSKTDIETLPDVYETFCDALNPVRFKYIEGASGRYHVGYIAQDVEAALAAAGLDTTDFGGFVRLNDGELGLAYDEFIALLHQKIKRLEGRLSALESA